MTSESHLIRAPQGAIAWTPDLGYLYEREEVPRHVEASSVVLVVGSDGWLEGVTNHDRALLTSLLRIDADLDQLVQRLDELADRAAGLDTGLAVEVNALKGRVRQLENRGQV